MAGCKCIGSYLCQQGNVFGIVCQIKSSISFIIAINHLEHLFAENDKWSIPQKMSSVRLQTMQRKQDWIGFQTSKSLNFNAASK